MGRRRGLDSGVRRREGGRERNDGRVGECEGRGKECSVVRGAAAGSWMGIGIHSPFFFFLLLIGEIKKYTYLFFLNWINHFSNQFFD